MKQRKDRIALFLLSLLFLVFVFTVTTVFSSPSRSSQFPQQPISPTLYQQGVANWCGPGSLQSAIQWVKQYNNGTPVATIVPIIPKATLWAKMRDNTCYELGWGRDIALAGTIGDGFNEVRKLNIAYDFGVDPHAMAWMMWR